MTRSEPPSGQAEPETTSTATTDRDADGLPQLVSVVLELENAGLAGWSRALDATRAVGQELARARDELGCRFELLVCYDPRTGDEDGLEEFLARSGLSDRMERVTYVPVPDGHYTELKNAGGRRAGGQVLLFIDSDVIPEHGALVEALREFGSPGVDVVSPPVYIEATDTITAAYALFGPFPVRGAPRTDQENPALWLNSPLMRRSTFERYPFLERPTFKWHCEMSMQMDMDRVEVRRLTDRHMRHPAPPDLPALLARGQAKGSDLYLSGRLLGMRLAPVIWLRALAGALRGALRGAYRVQRDHSAVDLGPPGVLAAHGYSLLYHAAAALGASREFLAHLLPPGGADRLPVVHHPGH